jgi:diguanylate cyclase (GGDEF)-like protein
MLFIEVVGLSQINTVHGWRTGDEVLRHVARNAAGGLRLADILFRNGGSEFVALLNDTGPEEAKAISKRISESVLKSPLVLRGERTITVEVSIFSASAPRDGESLSDLVAAARRPHGPQQANRGGSTIH